MFGYISVEEVADRADNQREGSFELMGDIDEETEFHLIDFLVLLPLKPLDFYGIARACDFHEKINEVSKERYNEQRVYYKSNGRAPPWRYNLDLQGAHISRWFAIGPDS